MNKDLKATLRKGRTKNITVIPRERLLSSGSTLLNVAATGRSYGCYVMGHYFWVAGDSDSGKTWWVLTTLAEATMNKNFDNHRLIFDNAEGGALMDIGKYFGPQLVQRLEAPAVDKATGLPRHSETIEDFYFNVDDAQKKDKPFIYVLDSMDSLSSKYDQAKFEERKTEARGGKKAKGDYGDGKAKYNSRNLRRVVAEIKRTDSILIIISQTRDNIDAGPFEDPSVTSGGRALKFYATLQLHTRPAGAIKRTVRGKDRQLGVNVACRIKKNRITGRDRAAKVPIYHSFGIDDIGSCVDYLVMEKHWAKPKGKTKIEAEDFGVELERERLIAYIEEEELQRDLRALVVEVWDDIETKCSIERAPRYGQE